MAVLKDIILLLMINFVVCSATSPSIIPSKRILRHLALLHCVTKDGASDEQLQAAKKYVCGKGVNCGRIEPGGDCYNPNTLNFHTSVVINSYYRAHLGQEFYCNGDGPLQGVGDLIFWDPSQGSCKFD